MEDYEGENFTIIPQVFTSIFLHQGFFFEDLVWTMHVSNKDPFGVASASPKTNDEAEAILETFGKTVWYVEVLWLHPASGSWNELHGRFHARSQSKKPRMA